MRFRLTYRGPLKPHRVSGGPDDPDKMAPHVHRLRKMFHPQLRQLWSVKRSLKEHETYPSDYGLPSLPNGERRPLVELVAQRHIHHGFRFVPLVRKDWSLECSLSILFLRLDQPGTGLLHAGDIDNRIKTLIDALRYPLTSAEVGDAVPDADEDPFFCLLEKDEYVTRLSVETDHLLLTPPSSDPGTVELVITVDVTPYEVTMFNLSFA